MSWSLHNLAPICPVPHCPKYGTRHLLPHQEEIATQILTGQEIYWYYQGGVGTAKTLLWGILAAAFMIMIPGCRIILCRRDFGLLYETLWRYFRLSIEAACEQSIIQGNPAKLFSGKSKKMSISCELPNGSYARAIQLKAYAEAMGPSYDAIFISDAMENPNFGEIFHGEGVVGGLQSRLRGQAASFYKLTDGNYKDMRRFLIESNPPPSINELHTIFGREPGVRTLPGTEITYRHIQTTSLQNDHNPASYVAEIASMHSNPADILRILQGKTVPYYGGVRCIPSFQPEVHVHQVQVDPQLPLFVGIDPGVQHPAVTFSQIKRCAYDLEHYITLSEISNLYDKTTNELVEYDDRDLLGILAHLALFYPSHFDYAAYKAARDSLKRQYADDMRQFPYHILEQHFTKVRFCIDKSGRRVYSTSKDRETDEGILYHQYGIKCKYKTDIGREKSLERRTELFKKICICNIPTNIVSTQCHLLIDAYSGGYRYAKLKDGSHTDKPIEDHKYEDIADADRYSLENFYWTPQPTVDDIQKYTPDTYYPSWTWMEARHDT